MSGARRTLMAGAALLLAGCASLESDLKAADGKCVPATAMTAFVTCLDGMEEPVWRKDSPDNLPGYRTFAATRLMLAQDLDSGKVTAAQFRDGADAARAKFNAELAQNARSGEARAEAQRAQDAMQRVQQQMTPDGMGAGMAMDHNMGM